MEYFHLTTPQKNIWNLQKYYEGTAIGNQCGTIIFSEERNIALLQQAICQFIRSQSGIRLRFCEESEPRQYVSEEIDTTIPFLSFSCMDELDRYAECFSQTPIGLVNTQMYRFIVFQVDQKSGILVTLSHLISDAWTFGLMANQIDVAYRQLAGAANLLPAKTADALLKADYIDYVQFENTYLSSERYIKDKKYWEEKYSSCPEKSQIKTCAIPTQSVEAKRIIKTLPLDLKWKIEKYCKKYSVSPAVLFETVLITYLSKINSESTSITIGVLVLNRSNAKQKNIAGMFISTMPLTITLSENMTLAGLATQITKEHIGIFRHQKYPYSDILAFLRERQNFSGNLYDVMVSYQNAKTNTDAETKWYSNDSSEVPFALHIDDRDGSNEYTLTVDYQTDIFREDVEVELIIDRLEYILEQITENSTRFIKDVYIIPKQEFKKLIFEFNDTHADYQKDKCVHELFFDQVNKTPDKLALIYENKEFSYRQLNEMTNSLAHFLRKAGVRPNDVVPIMAERSWQIIVAMLGILKAGGAFMSIDVTHPTERIKYILESIKSKMILVSNMEIQTEATDKLDSDKNTIIDLSKFDFSDNSENIENVNHPDDLCYVIYTSGSTGTPKGLSICHRNGVNFCNKNHFNVNNKIINSADTVFLSITNTIFDMFITELFIPLTSGMTILFANEQEASMGEPLELLCQKRHPNIIETTPTKLKMLLSSGNFTSIANFKAIILGGEPLTSTFYKHLRKQTTAKIFNNYGPAETTVWSTISEVTGKDINIGKPIANTQIYIIDKNNAPLPIGVAGELCIAGDGVGKGYLNRPDLTVEKFVPNPFSTKENHLGKTMYHTGDLARWRADGNIEYLGRIDTQVKIRGLRIESVSGNSMADDFSVYYSGKEKQFCETSFYIGQPLDNVYIRSKFEAERAVYDAMLDGLEAKIIRVGNLTNRTTDFKFQPNYAQNAFLTRLKAMLEFGLFPDYLRPLYVKFSPVDLTAKGIIQIAQFADEPCIFHLNSNRTIYFNRFLEIIRELGISMKIVNGTTFYNALQETLKNNDTSYIFEAFQNDMDEHGRLVYDSNIHIKNDFTVWFLKRLDFEWNKIDAKYVSGYINYFRKLGYLKV